MTDRELLEAAAKAAGIEIDFSRTNGGGRFNTGFDAAGNAVLDWREYKTWNPLTDDGDALRLAVKLSMRVYVYADHGDDFTCVATDEALQTRIVVNELHNGDPYKATRLAIVRTAAGIRRRLP